MKVHSVHARDISAPPEQVGALLDGVGSKDDRLWPIDRRPTLPFELDGRLANRRGRRAARTTAGGRRGPDLDGVGRVGAVAVPAALVALAALHAAWALGWRWPGGSDRELAERVLSGGAELPPEWTTWVVAIALAGAAAVVRATASGEPSPTVRRLAWGVAGVFLVRGTVYVPIDLIRGFDDLYERLDIALYSPLCLALGVGAAAVARRRPAT